MQKSYLLLKHGLETSALTANDSQDNKAKGKYC